ncbi:fructosamine kinase family protein [Thiohalobacter thiocyanaticus]|uniref:Fructosamine kinase family protein n=1 Tax=Thiohalobacter thiocyanaticus TaxID=585455 RepID=A0A426QJZ0_9GAMM|nr:fructosamine kinase family protein [Thiohalobacter thiocyanaticus]RRQ22068.1 fructosamine kinase family protein [Thiohalobacter thiocyanaticus]
MSLWQQIQSDIREHTGVDVSDEVGRGVGGGCISQAFRVEGDDGSAFFVKTNRAELADMFEAEAEGLNEIVASRSVRAPAPVCHGVADGQCYLVLEHLEFGGGRGAAAELGERLAQMHRTTRDAFGWHRDNTIGSTPQINTPQDSDWIAFWREKRLGFQLELAERRGFGGRLRRVGEKLMERFPALFDDYTPAASLLHGDLWGGNHAVLKSGEPVIFDPAVYFGDREADIAMTELFGGFGRDFYSAYNAAWPLDTGYPVRRQLYNLYHILNHLNLFGGGYHGQAVHMTESLLAELR